MMTLTHWVVEALDQSQRAMVLVAVPVSLSVKRSVLIVAVPWRRLSERDGCGTPDSALREKESRLCMFIES